MMDTTAPPPRARSCPSASAEDPRARVFGIVHGAADAPRVIYLPRPVRMTPALRAKLGSVAPGEVFRAVSPCAESGCQHFASGACGIGKQVAALDEVTSELPLCTIRATCRWFSEHGGAVCLRCSQVVTLTFVTRADKRARRRLPILQSLP